VLAKFPHRNGRVFLNATDFANFQKHDPSYRLGTVLPKRPGQKIVGFHGGLHVGRVDEQLLDALIVASPDATFLFVGYSNSTELVARLSARPNVVIHPAVPFKDLPNVIKSFDVAIIPHEVNEHTRGNDLLKVNDYLASGVPIVSTDVSNVRRHGAAIQVASTHAEFIAKVRGFLDGAPHDPAPGLAAAEAKSWHRAVPELATWLDGVLAQ
jgi:glycosyltransferase involved in cell wall biosynthesis